MPEETKVQEPLTPAEEARIHLPADVWADIFAAKIAVKDFEAAQSYRTANHDWRWRDADEVYLAWVAQRCWEGTRVPRSSLAIFVALQQIESLLPKVLSSIFGDNPWFQVAPRPGTSPDEARATQDLLLWQLEEARSREVCRRAFKSALIYGNGIVEVGWKYLQEQRRRYIPEFVPKRRTLDLSLLGFGRVTFPTGEFIRRVREQEYTDTINMPFLNYISLKDFYIDPNCPSPQVQDARFAVVRALKAVDELKALRDTENFKIPPDSMLHELAIYKPAAQADWTKGGSETYRQASWQPQLDTSSDPGSKRVEVLAYWTRDRLVWVLNRRYTALNIANPYGFIPFFNAFYVDVLDRFYSLAVTDVVGPEQRLTQNIINARLDELSLAIHPTRIKRRGLSIPAYQLRRRPGQLVEAENPKEDIVTEVVQNITQQAFVEVAASEARVQKSTGVTDLAVLGTPAAGGNAAARTATGVGVQAQASFSRIQYLVENAEDTFIEPVLNAVKSMNERYLDPEQVIAVLGPEGKFIEIDPLTVKNSRVKFSMRASAKMQSRMALLQTFPLLAQTFLNPAFMQLLAQQQGKVVNVEELGNMLLDATGYRSRTALFRELTEQETAALQAPPPEKVAEAEMQRERLARQSEDVDAKAEADLAKTIVSEGIRAFQATEAGSEEG